jgi:hypothetical protein
LSIVEAWIVAGKPLGNRTLGGFEGWSQVIGGILEVAGIPGFLGNLDRLRERADQETGKIRAFVDCWAARFGLAEVKANERSRSTRLGKLLQVRVDQVFGRYVIRRGGILNGYNMWRLEEHK